MRTYSDSENPWQPLLRWILTGPDIKGPYFSEFFKPLIDAIPLDDEGDLIASNLEEISQEALPQIRIFVESLLQAQLDDNQKRVVGFLSSCIDDELTARQGDEPSPQLQDAPEILKQALQPPQIESRKAKNFSDLVSRYLSQADPKNDPYELFAYLEAYLKSFAKNPKERFGPVLSLQEQRSLLEELIFNSDLSSVELAKVAERLAKFTTPRAQDRAQLEEVPSLPQSAELLLGVCRETDAHQLECQQFIRKLDIAINLIKDATQDVRASEKPEDLSKKHAVNEVIEKLGDLRKGFALFFHKRYQKIESIKREGAKTYLKNPVVKRAIAELREKAEETIKSAASVCADALQKKDIQTYRDWHYARHFLLICANAFMLVGFGIVKYLRTDPGIRTWKSGFFSLDTRTEQGIQRSQRALRGCRTL